LRRRTSAIYVIDVVANLEVMAADARRMRGARPVVFSNLKTGWGLDVIANFIEAARQTTSRPPSGP